MNRFVDRGATPGWEGVETVVLLRIGVGLLVLWDVAWTFRYTIELYSTAGPALPLFAPADRSLEWIPSPGVAVCAQSLLGFAALAVALGWQTRSSLLLASVLLGWLRPLDLTWTFAKPTVIWLHLLVLLWFSRCGAWGSLDAAGRDRVEAASGPTWPRWLLQCLACFVYLGAAVTKLNSPWFAGGDLLQYSLLDRGWGGTNLGQWLATSPGLLRAASLGTIGFEIVFPVLVWVSRARPWVLLAAVIFHGGIALTLHVGSFSATMLVLLLAFLEPATVARWWSRLANGAVGEAASTAASQTGGRASGWRSWGVWLLVGLMTTSLGWGWQIQADWYGVFGRREMPALTRLTAGEVAGVLPGRAAPLADSIHRVSLGTRRGAREVTGPVTELRPGDTLWVLVQFSLPHPELRLEGELWTSDGVLGGRFEQKLSGGVTHALNGFEITPEFPAGEGRLRLQLNGHEVSHRRIAFAGPEKESR